MLTNYNIYLYRILTTAGWAVEEHTAGGLHAELEELVGMLHRVLNQLLELALHVLQPADVGPRHVRHFHHRLAQSRWR